MEIQIPFNNFPTAGRYALHRLMRRTFILRTIFLFSKDRSYFFYIDFLCGAVLGSQQNGREFPKFPPGPSLSHHWCLIWERHPSGKCWPCIGRCHSWHKAHSQSCAVYRFWQMCKDMRPLLQYHTQQLPSPKNPLCSIQINPILQKGSTLVYEVSPIWHLYATHLCREKFLSSQTEVEQKK